jgi:hypothetical protein
MQRPKITLFIRHINMWAINGIEEGKALSYPKEEWAAIKKKTIDDYYADFVKHVLKK